MGTATSLSLAANVVAAWCACDISHPAEFELGTSKTQRGGVSQSGRDVGRGMCPVASAASTKSHELQLGKQTHGCLNSSTPGCAHLQQRGFRRQAKLRSPLHGVYFVMSLNPAFGVESEGHCGAGDRGLRSWNPDLGSTNKVALWRSLASPNKTSSAVNRGKSKESPVTEQ